MIPEKFLRQLTDSPIKNKQKNNEKMDIVFLNLPEEDQPYNSKWVAREGCGFGSSILKHWNGAVCH